jgi:DNA repair protein RecO (recombination protein O)
MEWSDEAIVLHVRPHGETAAVAEVLTRDHGRHLGLVYGGRSRRMRPVLQIGNHVAATWKGRLSEHLGSMTLELHRPYAAEAMNSALALAGLVSMATLARLLPERDPHPSLYEVGLFVLSYLDDPAVWPALMVRWELLLLTDLGFGLDLESCAATGAREHLIYVSPKSGRAVSEVAGGPYKDKLLPLPGFLRTKAGSQVTSDDVVNGFALTGHFLETRVLGPRDQPIPEARHRMIELLAQRRAKDA